jgi:hypothetical protein
VIDFGDLCAGDPAYDLAAGWLLLPDCTIDDFNCDASRRMRMKASLPMRMNQPGLVATVTATWSW